MPIPGWPFSSEDEPAWTRLSDLCVSSRCVQQGTILRMIGWPMVMTALAVLPALLAIGFITGAGVETTGPFALVIFGGLLADTAITLILTFLFPLVESDNLRELFSPASSV